jgi:hypothetical protein
MTDRIRRGRNRSSDQGVPTAILPPTSEARSRVEFGRVARMTVTGVFQQRVEPPNEACASC